jgi:hypothetical protein
MSDVPTKPKLKPWRISDSERSQILRMKRTSDWLIRPTDPSEFEPFFGQYIVARDCKIIASSPTYAELKESLDEMDDSQECLVIACFKGGRFRISK